MKKSICLAFSLLALNLQSVLGQPAGTLILNNGALLQNQSSALTKFNLDFAGGPPKLLVKAIEKATGKPLNVIIPAEGADVDLPPLKMDNVDVAHLFSALELASAKEIIVFTGATLSGRSSNYTTYSSGYGFKTDDAVSDNSVWYFHAGKPAVPPVVPVEKVCQFYSLSPYLDRGFTVDDITTAIQTGWKMSGMTPTPELNYHKETKLLIAYGEPDKLKTITDVLRTLPVSNITLPEAKEYWNHIQDLQGQIDNLKKGMTVQNLSTNTAPTEKSGK